jgi:FkbM family methyltransferase
MQTNPFQPFPSFVELADCRYGRMLYPQHDQYVGRSFKEYGQFSQGEVEIFTYFIRPGAVVLDVGANIGAHTIPLAQLAGPGGAVVAFEPQPILHRILCANLVLNSIPNALTYAMALGNSQGTCLIPILDYSKFGNFGGVSMDVVEEGEPVPLGRLDDFHLERVDFIKLDVEGFESQVLEGAADTIHRCHPVMYVENDRAEKSADLIQRLFDMGYRLWWHTPALFSPDNFKANPENIFPNIVSINMVAVHRDRNLVTDLREITSAEDLWK